jgi:hypothetical protein
LPKICGNIARSYVTVTAGLALFSGCNAASPTTVAIAAHYVPACAPPAESAPEELELVALGDFDRSNDSVAILPSDASLRGVSLPRGTLAAELNTLGEGVYWGSGTLDPDNQLPILLWPRNRPCSLARFDSAGDRLEDAGNGAWLLGGSARLGALLVTHADRVSPGGSMFIDLDRADAQTLDGGRQARDVRRGASLSELGDSLVLAGGIDVANGRVLGDAERFDPDLGRFTGESIELALPRTHHAALGLSPGRSLLIGGESTSGQALGSVELLSTDSLGGVFELLRTPRVQPQAVLLGRGRILVGGGHVRGPDDTRRPIDTVEFLSTDLTDVVDAPFSLAPGALDRAFVALGSGAALAVGGCQTDSVSSDCLPCNGGCVSRDVWWIDPRGEPHPLEQLPTALAVPEPRLVPGAGGRPWLLADGRLGQFDPWLGRFTLVDAGRGAVDLALIAQPLPIGPGLFAWLEPGERGVELVGFYHSQRGPFTQDVAPLLVGSAEGIVPHQPPTGDAGPGRLAYDAAAGLELSGSAAVVSVADTEYAAFTLDLSLASGPPPLIQLVATDGDEDAAFGGFECPWPALDTRGQSTDGSEVASLVRLRVERSFDRVRLEQVADGVAVEPRPEPCLRSLPERVGVQLVGTPAGVTRLRRIEIRRSID